MADPLYQVLADARAALDVLVTGRHWPGTWCDAADGLAAFLMLAIVAAWLHGPDLFCELQEAYLALIATAIIPVLIYFRPAAGAG
jgi:hypothetical protein